MSEREVAENSWPDTDQLEAAVQDVAIWLRTARRRGRTPNRIELVNTLHGLFEKLASGERLFIVNKVATCFAEVAIDEVPPRPEEVLAFWELAYLKNEALSLDELRKHVEQKTNSREMRLKAEAWQTARKSAEEAAKKVGEADVNDPRRLKELSEDAGEKAGKQKDALDKLVKLIIPETEKGELVKLIVPETGEEEDFSLDGKYVDRLAEATQQHEVKREEKRRRGLKPDGVRIRHERALKDWSRTTLVEQTEAATGKRLSTRTIARVEDGQASDLDTLDAIARTFNLKRNEIVVG